MFGHHRRDPAPLAPQRAGAQPPSTQQLRKWFDSIDKDRNGVLSVTELQAALAEGGMNFSMAMVASIIRQCDKDGSGSISFAEFEKLNEFLGTVQTSFGQYDRDGDGKLSQEELGAALQGLGYNLDAQVLGTVFSRFDPLRNGKLGLQEFLALVMFLRNANTTFRAFDSYKQGSVTLNFSQFLYAAAHTI